MAVGDTTESGYSEAPYALSEDVDETRQRIADFLAKPEYEWLGSSPSRDAGLGALDFIACRHSASRCPHPLGIGRTVRRRAHQQSPHGSSVMEGRAQRLRPMSS